MPSLRKSQRPPKPVPFVYDGAAAATSGQKVPSGGGHVELDQSETTTASREHLRKDLEKKRKSLTLGELQFLEGLCMHGDEIEVELAHERLQDNDLFFDPTSRPDALNEESERGWTMDQGIRVGKEYSTSSLRSSSNTNNNNTSISSIDFSCNSSVNLNSLGSSDALGSEKRQERLLRRKSNSMFEMMWKSHANGIGVSKTSSRRSLLARRTSLSSSSRNLVDLADFYARPETEAIFRNSTKNLMDDTQSDNIRRRSAADALFMSDRRMMNDNKSDNSRRSFHFLPRPRGARRASSLARGSLKLPPKPALYRRLSEGSRKSVTFKEEISSGRKSITEGVQRPRQLERWDSNGSIPSIHHAQRISSPTSSDFSVPSLHHAHPLQASAASNLTSWTGSLDDSLSREARDAEEEKKADVLKVPPVPSKVEILSADSKQHIQGATKLLSHNEEMTRPVLMRRASRNTYNGEGIEVADLATAARHLDVTPSLSSFGGGDPSIATPFSFDETMSFSRISNIFRRKIERSLSDENLTGIFLGGSRLLLRETSSLRDVNPDIAEDDSWGLDDEPSLGYYDPWKVIEDEYENGYGGGGTLPFLILGTSADDLDAHPHVLSPPLMESLQSFFPFSVSGENFWFKYSLVKHGASLHTLLQRARGSRYSILAIETVEGEVFGCFTTEPWRKNWNYFGGGESFLWRMRHSRREKHMSIIDQAQSESEIDVYPYTGENNCIQLCTHDKIAVGGGTADSSSTSIDTKVKDHEWGFGLTIESDMIHGTSSPSLTFGSPSLSVEHSDGSRFEIINLELWTLTPCILLEDAEKLELGLLFLKQHSNV